MSLFDCPGNVHPATYDWKKVFGGLAHSTRESRLFYVELDVSRVLGLAQYTEELELQVRVQFPTTEEVEEKNQKITKMNLQLKDEFERIHDLEKKVKDLETKLREKEVKALKKKLESS